MQERHNFKIFVEKEGKLALMGRSLIVMKGSQKMPQALKVEYFMKSKEALLLKFLRLIKATKGLTVSTSSEYTDQCIADFNLIKLESTAAASGKKRSSKSSLYMTAKHHPLFHRTRGKIRISI